MVVRRETNFFKQHICQVDQQSSRPPGNPGVIRPATAWLLLVASYGPVQCFDAKSDRMIWTAKTNIFDAGNLDDLVIQFANVLINDLIAKGVISAE